MNFPKYFFTIFDIGLLRRFKISVLKYLRLISSILKLLKIISFFPTDASEVISLDPIPLGMRFFNFNKFLFKNHSCFISASFLLSSSAPAGLIKSSISPSSISVRL